MNYKICALGDAATLFPFMQIGVDVFSVDPGEDLSKKIASVVKKGYGLLFVSEDVVRGDLSVIHSYDKRPEVNIVLVPGNSEGESYGLERINEMVEKALGQNIL